VPVDVQLNSWKLLVLPVSGDGAGGESQVLGARSYGSRALFSKKRKKYLEILEKYKHKFYM
jgi:hypothetical protein